MKRNEQYFCGVSAERRARHAVIQQMRIQLMSLMFLRLFQFVNTSIPGSSHRTRYIRSFFLLLRILR